MKNFEAIFDKNHKGQLVLPNVKKVFLPDIDMR